MNSENKITIILGDEFDENLRNKLIKVLRELGAIFTEKNEILGGSQHIENIEILINGEKLFIESETYIGLSIAGPSEIVEKIKDLINRL